MLAWPAKGTNHQMTGNCSMEHVINLLLIRAEHPSDEQAGYLGPTCQKQEERSSPVSEKLEGISVSSCNSSRPSPFTLGHGYFGQQNNTRTCIYSIHWFYHPYLLSPALWVPSSSLRWQNNITESCSYSLPPHPAGFPIDHQILPAITRQRWPTLTSRSICNCQSASNRFNRLQTASWLTVWRPATDMKMWVPTLRGWRGMPRSKSD